MWCVEYGVVLTDPKICLQSVSGISKLRSKIPVCCLRYMDLKMELPFKFPIINSIME